MKMLITSTDELYSFYKYKICKKLLTTYNKLLKDNTQNREAFHVKENKN